MKSKLLFIVLLLSLAINGGILATIGYHYYSNASPVSSVPCFTSHGDNHLYQSLGLSNLQLSKIEPMAHKFHGQLSELQTVMEQKRGFLIDLLKKNNNSSEIEKLRKEIAGIQDEIQKEVISHILDIKKILDENQQQRFFNLMNQSMIGGKFSGSTTIGGKE
jgi:Spy/CpxP family protein refolding chaperone